jgi:hypothetical protein
LIAQGNFQENNNKLQPLLGCNSISGWLFGITKKNMVTFSFRPARIKKELAMGVGLQNIQTGECVPDLSTATVINFSPEGACLVLTKLIFDGKHLFYSTLDSDSYNLLLSPEAQNDDSDDAFSITAQSVWMDTCNFERQPAFKIGIRFLTKQNKVFKLLKKNTFF